jgi:hypothetical protein
MKSKVEDLVAATEAAQQFLRITHLVQDTFRQLKSPDTPGTRQFFAAYYCLPYFIELRRCTRAFDVAFTERVRWELAGVASPGGVQAGAATFASAHDILSDAARVSSTCLDGLLITPKVRDDLDRDFDWNRGERSIPKNLMLEYVRYWEGGDHYPRFLTLLWEMVETLRFVDVLRLRGILDCEHALARRGRGVAHNEGRLPRSHLSTTDSGDPASPFTGQISWSPSTRPNVLRFVRAADELRRMRSTKEPLSLAGIYRRANLKGNSQTRAKDAALRLKLVTARLEVTARGSRLIREDAQAKQ